MLGAVDDVTTSDRGSPVTAANQILVALDAHDCVRGTRALRARDGMASRRKPVATAGADFGADVSFGWSGSDLKDAIVNWQKRMGDLAANYAKLTPTWSVQDPAGFADWTNDWKVLQSRYAPALAAAQDVANSTFGWGTDAAFDTLAKAMRVSYPPDGGPVSKGDYDDLYARLATAARSVGNVPLQSTPLTQPTGTDLGMAFFKATAPLDIVASATGQQAPTAAPFGGPALKWVMDHYKGLLIGGAVVVGATLVLQLFPLLMMPVKAAKGVAALAA